MLYFIPNSTHLHPHKKANTESAKKKGQIESNKVIQLIIILIDSSEFTARPRKVGKGGQRGQTWRAPSCPSPSGESKEPPAKFSFSHLLLFFFFFFFLGHPECKKYDLPLWCSNRNEAIKLWTVFMTAIRGMLLYWWYTAWICLFCIPPLFPGWGGEVCVTIFHAFNILIIR